MSVAKDFFEAMEDISYQVATGKINKDLLNKIMIALLNNTYAFDKSLKLEIYNALS